MKSDSITLNRSEKILVFLYEFSASGRAKVRYEDIVVGLFKKYPSTFHLKGYKEYPSEDLVDKALYEYKKRGYVNAANKLFSLTARGVELAKLLSGKSKTDDFSKSQLSRSSDSEIARVKKLEGYKLFIRDDKNRLSDSDFYDYLGVTVRTQRNSFIGRLNTMNAVIEELGNHPDDPFGQSVRDYHTYLMTKHQDIIDFFIKK